MSTWLKLQVISMLVWIHVFENTSGQCIPVLTIDPSEIKEGEESWIRCQVNSACDAAFMEYFKRPVNDTYWRRAYRMNTDNTGETFTSDNGYSLKDRVSIFYLQGDFQLTILDEESQKSDSGEWQCVYHDKDGSTQTSNIKYLIATAPCSLQVNGPDEEYFAIGQPYEYTCLCPDAYPEIDPKWYMGGKAYVGKSSNKMNGYVWNITNHIELTAMSKEDTNVTCILEKDNGVETWITGNSTAPEQERIRYRGSLENCTSGTIQINTRSKLIFECIASGTDIVLSWYKDSEILPGDLFTESTIRVQGNFSYGQTNAIKSTLTWITPPSSSSTRCKFKTKHNGEYRALVVGFGEPVESNKITVEFIHINACISDVGLTFIIVGSFGIVGLIVGSVVGWYCCWYKKGYCCCFKKG